jgi:predicted peptidase
MVSFLHLSFISFRFVYSGVLAVALLVAGLVAIVVFMLWVFELKDDNVWPGANNTLKKRFYEMMDFHCK